VVRYTSNHNRQVVMVDDSEHPHAAASMRDRPATVERRHHQDGKDKAKPAREGEAHQGNKHDRKADHPVHDKTKHKSKHDSDRDTDQKGERKADHKPSHKPQRHHDKPRRLDSIDARVCKANGSESAAQAHSDQRHAIKDRARNDKSERRKAERAKRHCAKVKRRRAKQAH
jgi:hypothetical protein